jgi:transcriptional regulator with XRE-family HTH domain
MVDTPLRRWLIKNGQTITGLARSLEVSRARAQWWVNGAVMPRGMMLDTLITLTGLTVKDFLPNEEVSKKRRLQKLRRLGLPKVQLRVVKLKGKPKSTLTVKSGKTTRTHRNDRRAYARSGR